jgi:GH18 family chitinase
MLRNKIVLHFSLLAWMGAGCAAPTSGGQMDEVSEAVTNGTVYTLKLSKMSGDTGNCVDIAGNSSADGAKVEEWDCNSSGAQNLVAEDMGGGYWRFRHDGTNSCLNVDCPEHSSACMVNGRVVHQWTCGTGPEYQWKIVGYNGYSQLQSRYSVEAGSPKCLDITGGDTFTANGTQVEIWTCGASGTTKGNQTVNIATSGGGGGGGSSPKTVGYVVGWKTGVSVPYSKLSHINYAFALPTANGSLQSQQSNDGSWGPVQNPSWLQSVVSGAHGNGGKVLLSVGGWMSDSPNPGSFASLAGNSSYRSTFVNALVGLVNQYGLDGVDIDWEYPCPNNGGSYATLLSDLASAMHSRGKLLSAAVAAFGANGDCVGSSVFSSVDQLNLMAYDIRDPNHSTYQDGVDSINYWKGKGLSASKTVLGLPFYAHPSWKAYNTKVGENGANRCRDSDGSDYWNGIPTIRSKSSFARSNAGGVMLWEMSQDTTGSDSLTTAAWEAVTGRAGSYGCP